MKEGVDAQARRHRSRRRPRHPDEEPRAEGAPPARGPPAHLLRGARRARRRGVATSSSSSATAASKSQSYLADAFGERRADRSVQAEQRGTGHAALAGASRGRAASSSTLVLYGDAPLLEAERSRGRSSDALEGHAEAPARSAHLRARRSDGLRPRHARREGARRRDPRAARPATRRSARSRR